MISRKTGKFAVKPVVAAVALAVSAAGVYAAPTPNQMPGAGRVMAISAGGAFAVNSVNVPLLADIVNLPNFTRIDVSGQVVLNWGVTGGPADLNPSGFNLGAGATLIFGGTVAAVPNPAVLNVDVSGNPSQLFGTLIATDVPTGFCPTCTVPPQIFVANANGIVVGAGGRIVAPNGVGLLGANFNSALQRDEFIANNDSTTSFIDIIGGQSGVEVHGSINGDVALNLPAAYVLLAGGSITNTGNIFAMDNFIAAGLRASPSLATVNGVTGVTVNRYWNVTAGTFAAFPFITPLPGGMEIATAGSGVVNTGSISSVGGYIFLGATGDVRSGTMGSTDTQVGLYADSGVIIDAYSDSSKVELYNVVSGYTTNKTLPQLQVNLYSYLSGFAPDVTINALTPGAQPSSITTTDGVIIAGGNVTINSTINHKDKAGGGAQGAYDLAILGSKSVTVAASVGAGDNVNIVSGGPLTISGNVLSDTNTDTVGGISVANTGAGAPTTISGNLLVPGSVGFYQGDLNVVTNGPTTVSGTLTNVNNNVNVYNNGTGAGNSTTISNAVVAGNRVNIYNGPNTSAFPLTISGIVTGGSNVNITNLGSASGNLTTISNNVVSTGGGVYVNNGGVFDSQLNITGPLSAYDIEVFSGGNASVAWMYSAGDIDIEVRGTSLMLNGPLTALNDVDINALFATTKALPAAVITAPSVYLDVLHFTGVNAAGDTYANLGEKPAAQIVTNMLDVDITGSINAPIAGNTNWLDNGLTAAPLDKLAPVYISVSATGGGFQAINLAVTGNMLADSGTTTTPFIGVPLTTGGFPAGGLQGNVGSSMVLQATGWMTLFGTPTGSLFGPPLAFQFPGGLAFKAGVAVTTLAPVYNAWTTVAIPYQGQWYEAPIIMIGSFLATSGNTWTNFSTMPGTGMPTTYQIREINPNAFGFALAPEAVHKNTYSAAILGGPICMTGGPTTFTVCP